MEETYWHQVWYSVYIGSGYGIGSGSWIGGLRTFLIALAVTCVTHYVACAWSDRATASETING